MTQVTENIGGEYRNRTGVHGFAIRCVTTPPTRLAWCVALLSHYQGCRKWHNSPISIRRALLRKAICAKPRFRRTEQTGLAE